MLKRVADYLGENRLESKGALFLLYGIVSVVALINLVNDLIGDWEWLDAWQHTERFHTFTGDACIVLSLVLVISALVTMCRTFMVAYSIQEAKHWYSACGCKNSVTKVLYALCFILLILATMKMWSITDSIYTHWLMMSHEYHVRAYVYLVENYGVVIISWVVTSYYKRVTICASKPRMYLSDQAVGILSSIKAGVAYRAEDKSFNDMIQKLAIELRVGQGGIRKELETLDIMEGNIVE